MRKRTHFLRIRCVRTDETVDAPEWKNLLRELQPATKISALFAKIDIAHRCAFSQNLNRIFRKGANLISFSQIVEINVLCDHWSELGWEYKVDEEGERHIAESEEETQRVQSAVLND